MRPLQGRRMTLGWLSAAQKQKNFGPSPIQRHATSGVVLPRPKRMNSRAGHVNLFVARCALRCYIYSVTICWPLLREGGTELQPGAGASHQGLVSLRI